MEKLDFNKKESGEINSFERFIHKISFKSMLFIGTIAIPFLGDMKSKKVYKMDKFLYDLAEKKLIPNENIKLLPGYTFLNETNEPDIIDYYSAQWEWMKQTVGSQEYTRRALENENISEEELYDRLARIQLEPIVKIGDSLVSPEYSAIYDGENLHRTILPGDYKAPVLQNTNVPEAVHELAHQVTDAKNFVSQYAKDLYREAFDTEGFKVRIQNMIEEDKKKGYTQTEINKDIEEAKLTMKYLQEPTELDARKKVIEYEMDKSGLKKYGQRWTEKDLENLIELIDSGKLKNHNIKQFLISIKKEYFLKIMNTIAENISDEESVKDLTA